MTPAEMIAVIRATIESRAGYAYSGRVLDAIVVAGVIPDRAIVTSGSDWYGVYYSDRIARVRQSDLVEISSLPMTPERHDALLMMYAERAAINAVRPSRRMSIGG